MGARLKQGNSTLSLYQSWRSELAEFVHKPAGLLLNFGYQVNNERLLQALVDRNDFWFNDSLSHACLVDGKQLAMADKAVFPT